LLIRGERLVGTLSKICEKSEQILDELTGTTVSCDEQQ
jgi:hypothetical protein